MPKPQTFRDVDVPNNFGEWDVDARVNYLANCLDRKQIANYVRECADLPEREQPTMLKDELVELAIKLQNE